MEEDAVMVEMDWPIARRRRRVAVAKRAASAMASSGVARESEWEAERVRASREAAGVLLFMPASAQRGQGQQGTWCPCGGKALLAVGHCSESENPIQLPSEHPDRRFQRYITPNQLSQILIQLDYMIELSEYSK